MTMYCRDKRMPTIIMTTQTLCSIKFTTTETRVNQSEIHNRIMKVLLTFAGAPHGHYVAVFGGTLPRFVHPVHCWSPLAENSSGSQDADVGHHVCT